MKSRFYLIAAAILITISSMEMNAQNITPDGTYMFAQRDTCDLMLDIYHPAKGSETTFEGKEKPTIVFMFGGGFVQGTRDDESYHPWFRLLTENGYGVISIDYRLGLKGSNKVGIAQVNVLDKAIHMAVEDLFSATRFIIDNAEQLDVDPDNLVISGSSAGAISVLQAEYELANRTSWAHELPQNFDYAGVMSFAGAILSREGKVDYKRTPAPTLMLHGTADVVVNYKQIRFLNLGFFGSSKLAERFDKFDFNYCIYRYDGYGHEIAGSMYQTFDIQDDFIKTNIIQGQKRLVDALVDNPEIEKGCSIASLDDIYGNQ